MRHSHSNILIIRLSAIGDVAIAAVVVRQAAVRFPETTFTMVSQPLMQPLFAGLPNLRFVGIDEKTDYRGLRGLWRLYRTVRAQRPDGIADIHNVFRTRVLRGLLRLSGITVCVLRKRRAARRRLSRRRHKVRQPLQPAVDRCREVIEQCVGRPLPPDTPTAVPQYAPGSITPTASTVVGIAPFAAYEGKIYPLEKTEQIVASYACRPGTEVLLFGGGRRECAVLEEWERRYPSVRAVAGKLKLTEELALMQRLSVMICMDSANMHFASFVGTPVVSVWGATHPDAGFYGWRQSPDNAVAAGLRCSPCSIYGNKSCFYRDYRCLHSIRPETVILRADALIQTSARSHE
ncbi:MAG: glycosyltransferase family 9 protein [Prevotellaceae bacterium]|jgi:ADP-heptose:LPS heptosyltransferase|nr:glycosyltransferase family 9 protein [Prevotellaceae bacterium]